MVQKNGVVLELIENFRLKIEYFRFASGGSSISKNNIEK